MQLEASSIEKWFFRGKGDSNRFFAVHRADLMLEPGKVMVLSGRSGSGKTTLMNMMAGLLAPSEGKILLRGKEPEEKKVLPGKEPDGQEALPGKEPDGREVPARDLYSLDDRTLSQVRNRYFGMIPQGADLLPELTVMENILLPHGICDRLCKEDLDALTQRARGLLEQMGIDGLVSSPARELSGGERRRVCVARALTGRPAFLFADEPTSDLDDENMQVVLTRLRKAADEGAAVMIVTHDREACEYADDWLSMNAGILGLPADSSGMARIKV